MTKSVHTGNPNVNRTVVNSIPEKSTTPPITSNQPVVKLVKLSPSSLVPPSTSESSAAVRDQEQIVEKAKQVIFFTSNLACLFL